MPNPTQRVPMRHHHDETYLPIDEGEHPNLAAHDTLGLATQAELNAHNHDATYVNESDHTLAAHDTLGVATQGELDAHTGAAAPHSGHAATVHGHDYAAPSHSHLDADIPASIARDAEVTSAISTHSGEADPHTGYRLESAAITDADVAAANKDGVAGTASMRTLGAGAQQAAAGNDSRLSDSRTPTAHVLNGASHTASGLTGGHVLRASNATAFDFAAIQDADLPATIARDSEVTTAISDHAAAADPHPGYLTPAEGNAAYEATGAVATHAAAADPHTGYQKESEKGAASGYASLGADTLVPQDQLGSGVQDGTKFLRDDGTWAAAAGGGTGENRVITSDATLANGYSQVLVDYIEVSGAIYEAAGDAVLEVIT